jgi:hypothetical protein
LKPGIDRPESEAENTFSLVINRHEAFDVFEVGRILKPVRLHLNNSSQITAGQRRTGLRADWDRLPYPMRARPVGFQTGPV